MGILRRIFGSPEDPLDELYQIVEGLEKGNLDCGTVHEKLKLINEFLYEEDEELDEAWFLRRILRKKRAEKVFYASILAEELLDMTMFDNKDLESFHFVRMILNEHLDDIYGNEYWGELIHRRGRLSALCKCTCRLCGFQYPYAMSGEDGSEVPLFCESCGDVTTVVVFHLEDEEAKHCKCGGKLGHYDPYVCPRCDGPTDGGVELSRYQYFQTHNYYQYPLSRGVRQRIVREHPET